MSAFNVRRKKLTDLEKKVMHAALAPHIKQSDRDTQKQYVVDVAIRWPKGLHSRLYSLFCCSSRRWPACFPSNSADRVKTPLQDSGAGLWSLLPAKYYRAVGRHGTTGEQRLLDILSDTLDFCDQASTWFDALREDVWPEAPSLTFCIESSHSLVASQRFASEEEGNRWLALSKQAFNSRAFVAWLHAFDRKQGFVLGAGVEDEGPWESDEQRYFHESDYCEPLQGAFCGWLSDGGVSISAIRMIASGCRDSRYDIDMFTGGRDGVQSTDKAVLGTIASLRDRGYILPRGSTRSPATTWDFPSECVLTGTGYQRAMSLENE